MKTATQIEEQLERKDARDNSADSADSLPELKQPVTQKHKRGDASYIARIAPWRFKPGQSGNPGGVPKHDVSKEIAQAIFLNNPEMIYTAYCRMMRRGNAYCFQVIAERAWGKLKERVEIDRGPFADLSDEDLRKRIRELETKLGVPHSEPETLPASENSKPN